ncbi:hypothetical protein AADZ90_006405 [Aestuariibius sp. 2305UL40-4]|uniref:hypothetical protein n=1 Tax=Aestuariibius violaceus TaxID=3234132 RepID=UPI00345EC3BC
MTGRDDEMHRAVKAALAEITPDPTAPERMVAALAKRRSGPSFGQLWWALGATVPGFFAARFAVAEPPDALDMLASGTLFFLGGGF